MTKQVRPAVFELTPEELLEWASDSMADAFRSKLREEVEHYARLEGVADGATITLVASEGGEIATWTLGEAASA